LFKSQFEFLLDLVFVVGMVFYQIYPLNISYGDPYVYPMQYAHGGILTVQPQKQQIVSEYLINYNIPLKTHFWHFFYFERLSYFRIN